jgi:EmrB/QacA subfamily drug resistance transporter
MTNSSPDPRRWWALALLCGAFFMVILDASIVFVALPSITAELSFSPQALQWVVTAYLLTFGGLLLLGGRAADLLGRRRVFMAGIVLFTLASLLCGLAWSPEALIAARALQGIGAAVMTPTALSILMTIFEEGPERNKALGIWGALGGIGATAGWLIGGPLTDGPGWEWVFFINVPVGAFALLLCPLLLRESRRSGLRRSYDPIGALSVTGGLVLLVYALVEAPETGWTASRTVTLLAAAVALLALFAIVESRSRTALLPLHLLRSRSIVGANAAMFVLAAVAFGLPFPLTLYAQQVLDYSALKFGATSVVMPVLAAAGSMAGQALVPRLGFRRVAVGGMLLLGAGCLVLSRVSAEGSYFGDIFLGLLLFGPGLGLMFVTASIGALAGVAESEAGLASGLNNTAFQIGGALGVAIVSTVAVARTDDFVAEHGSGNIALALTEGFQASFLACVAIVAVGLAAALLLPGRPRATEPLEAYPVPAGD